MTSYRAAYLTGGVGTLLTGPEHATLSDEDLLADARKELEKMGIPFEYESIEEAMEDVEIGDWMIATRRSEPSSP